MLFAQSISKFRLTNWSEYFHDENNVCHTRLDFSNIPSFETDDIEYYFGKFGFFDLCYDGDNIINVGDLESCDEYKKFFENCDSELEELFKTCELNLKFDRRFFFKIQKLVKNGKMGPVDSATFLFVLIAIRQGLISKYDLIHLYSPKPIPSNAESF